MSRSNREASAQRPDATGRFVPLPIRPAADPVRGRRDFWSEPRYHSAMTPEELASELEGIVHEPTQVGDHGVDLTVAEVHEVRGPGRVDFGGGELESPDLEPHERTWRDPDDDYQWWHLPGGTYLLEYNESASLAENARLQARRPVLASGASHPTLSVRELKRVPLTVSPGGIRIKENARVSTLRPARDSPGE